MVVSDGFKLVPVIVVSSVVTSLGTDVNEDVVVSGKISLNVIILSLIVVVDKVVS